MAVPHLLAEVEVQGEAVVADLGGAAGLIPILIVIVIAIVIVRVIVIVIVRVRARARAIVIVRKIVRVIVIVRVRGSPVRESRSSLSRSSPAADARGSTSDLGLLPVRQTCVGQVVLDKWLPLTS